MCINKTKYLHRLMKMSGGVMVCCAALFFLLNPTSAARRLNSISDLRGINIGRSVPETSIALLYWFANTVEIDDNDHIWLTFEPTDGDYGSHYYGNFEGLLCPLPWGHQYYSVGNIYQDSPVELPHYVVNQTTEDMEENIARIIFSYRGPNRSRRIDRVYLTQHYETSQYEGTQYDPQHTYEITSNLLREISQFSVGHNQRSLRHLRNQYARNTNNFHLNDIRNNWGSLAGLGLLLFIVIRREQSSNQPQRAARNTQPDFVVNTPQNQPKPKPNQNDPNNTHNYCFIIFVLIATFILLIIFAESSQRNRRW